MKRIGILTGGGDCPGLNGAIRAIVRRGVGAHGCEVLGFRNGWRGVMEGEAAPLTPDSVRGILHRGGTILGSSAANPYHEGGIDRVRAAFRDLQIDGLIAIGGEGTLGAAANMSEEGLAVIGIPKTIDNDISGTDSCIGFQTAVQVATDAIDRLHSTAESHNRVMLVEVMGRSAGWIALYAGLAGGAHVILIPEHPFDLEEVCGYLRRRHLRGRLFSIVVVAEGAVPRDDAMDLPEYPKDERGFPRFGGIAGLLGPEIERRTGFETRVTVLGHIQRGGTPSAHDRILATRFGIAAIDMAAAGAWGTMVALRGSDVVGIPLKEAVAEVRLVPEELYRVAEVFFGY
ncbi:MAG TPA: ATP-dependent 6-phosphofructokinase [Actinomycetota bacterium]